jgi:hypothetical protein
LFKDGAQCKYSVYFRYKTLLTFYRCDIPADSLEAEGGRRTHEHTESLMEAFDDKALWFDYGVIPGIMVRYCDFILWTRFSILEYSHLPPASRAQIYTNSLPQTFYIK